MKNIKKSVLYVDDCEEVCELMRDMGRQEDLVVYTTSTIDKAKKAIEGFTFDAVITDMVMSNGPGGQGDEIVSLVKEKNPEIPVVVLTGMTGWSSYGINWSEAKDKSDLWLRKGVDGDEISKAFNYVKGV